MNFKEFLNEVYTADDYEDAMKVTDQQIKEWVKKHREWIEELYHTIDGDPRSTPAYEIEYPGFYRLASLLDRHPEYWKKCEKLLDKYAVRTDDQGPRTIPVYDFPGLADALIKGRDKKDLFVLAMIEDLESM